jgi:hypothetical protein
MGLDALGGQQHPITAGAAVIGAELISRHSTMTDAEQAVYDVLKRLAPGNIYDVWVDEAELLGAMDPELDIEDRRRLLARMKDRTLLVEGAGKWRAVC